MAKHWTHIIGPVLLSVAGQGCTLAPGTVRTDLAPEVAAAPADPLQAFLAQASVGESALLEGEGGIIEFTVGEEYHAASGRLCRDLVVAEGTGPLVPRVACRGEQGAWHLLPLLRNRELPNLREGA